MKKAEEKKPANYFFVDESGDANFYNRYGEFIVGKEGCSKILMLGFIVASEPDAIRRSLQQLKNEIASDKYL